MKRFLVCSGLHGSELALNELQRLVRERRPDGLFFAGGILAPQSARPRWSQSGDGLRWMQRFFETLGELDVFSAVLPGPFDTPLEEFFRLGLFMEQEYPNVRLAHANVIAVGSLAVCGIGGCLVEEGSHTHARWFCPISREEIASIL